MEVVEGGHRPPEVQLEAFTLVFTFETLGSCSELVAQSHLRTKHMRVHSKLIVPFINTSWVVFKLGQSRL